MAPIGIEDLSVGAKVACLYSTYTPGSPLRIDFFGLSWSMR